MGAHTEHMNITKPIVGNPWGRPALMPLTLAALERARRDLKKSTQGVWLPDSLVNHLSKTDFELRFD